jgi:ElaB/YqjD/DUF883 family membrane-anchored ribosome-binding protein
VEQQNQPEVEQGGADQAASEVERQRREIAAAYEKARREMNDAVAKMRQEIEQIDFNQARQKAEDWTKQNPALAAAIAVGAGILLGKVISSALRPAPPPPLPVRLRKKAMGYASHAKDYAEELGEAFAAGAAFASGVVASKAADTGEKIAKRAAQWGETVAERADDVGDEVRKRAGRAGKAMQKDAYRLSKSLKKKTSKGMDLGESVLDAARTVAAAVLVKKATQWIKQLT